MMIVQIRNVPINNQPIPVDESTDFDWIGLECINKHSLKLLLRYS